MSGTRKSILMMVCPMEAKVEIDLRVNDEIWSDWPGELESDIQIALDTAAIATRGGQIDLLLTNDDEIQKLNAQWRGKDKPTDVLSFPSEEDAAFENFLGDIVVSHGVLTRDAAQMGKTKTAHLQHLIIHGYLHLLGFDHIEDDDAEEMEGLERKILAELGLPDPYSINTSI